MGGLVEFVADEVEGFVFGYCMYIWTRERNISRLKLGWFSGRRRSASGSGRSSRFKDEAG